MEHRPHIKIEPTQGDKILEICGWALLIILWVFVMVTYPKLPAIIPTHFDASGKVNNYGRRSTYIILPVIASVIFTGLTILNRFPWLYNYPKFEKENAVVQYTYATKIIRFLKIINVVIFLLVTVLTWQTATGKTGGLGKWFLPFTITIFLLPTAFYITKSLKAGRPRR